MPSTLLKLLAASFFICSAHYAISAEHTIDTHISCSAEHNEEDERIIHADHVNIHISGNQLHSLQWESSIFRNFHGLDCSIDDSDEPQAETMEGGWRITLKNPQVARDQRGFDFDRGFNCSIRIIQNDTTLSLIPSCPALCGSRKNFSELSINLKTGHCEYEPDTQ